jgi:hypothetical protein
MAYLEDYEKRLLFSALYREKKICEKVDEECTGKIKLKPIVESLENKFYYDRFEKEIRNKAIDEFAEKIIERLKGMQMAELQGEDVCPCGEDTLACYYMNSDVGCLYCTREQTIKDIDEIAEQMKGE